MSALDRTQPPASGSIRKFDFPDVERRTLSNGLDLRVCKLSRLPVVSTNLFFRAGEGQLVESRAGLAVLTGDALEGGTRKRSGTELAEALEPLWQNPFYFSDNKYPIHSAPGCRHRTLKPNRYSSEYSPQVHIWNLLRTLKKWWH